MKIFSRLFSSFIVNALSLFIIDILFKGIYFAENKSLLLTAFILTLVNSLIKPILKVLSLPLTIISLGLFSFVLNAFVLRLAFNLSNGAFIDSFMTTVYASIILSIINPTLNSFFSKE